MRVVCIGECMVELRQAARDLYARAFAGDAYNAAVYLKRSAPQAQVALLTATGEDPLSCAMREAFAAEGVEDAHAFTAKGREPGLYMIELDALGERRFHYWRSDSAARSWLRLLMQNGGADRLAGVDLVFLSGVSLAILPDDEARLEAIGLLASLRDRVGKIAFDVNLRLALWCDLDAARAAIAPIIKIADILRASREDAALLTGASEPEAQISGVARCRRARNRAYAGRARLHRGERELRSRAARAAHQGRGRLWRRRRLYRRISRRTALRRGAGGGGSSGDQGRLPRRHPSGRRRTRRNLAP